MPPPDCTAIRNPRARAVCEAMTLPPAPPPPPSPYTREAAERRSSSRDADALRRMSEGGGAGRPPRTRARPIPVGDGLPTRSDRILREGDARAELPTRDREASHREDPSSRRGRRARAAIRDRRVPEVRPAREGGTESRAAGRPRR